MNEFFKVFLALLALPSLILLSGCGLDDEFSGSSTPSVFNLHSITPSSGKTIFSWDESKNATEYQLCLKDSTKLNSCEILATTPTLNAEVSGLSALKALTSSYFVIAKNGGGSQRSNDKSMSAAEVSELIQYLKASNAGQGDEFGGDVSLSSDGNTLAIGSIGESSNGSNQADNSEVNSGAVYLFRLNGGVWAQEAYLKASNAGQDDEFGVAISLSSDGNTLAVGAYGESSGGSNQADNSEYYSGAVYLFRFNGGAWTQEAYLKASNAGQGDEFGGDVSLSSDGNTLAVGALGESSNGVSQTDNSEDYSGAVYLFRFNGGAWVQEAYLKASNAGQGDEFGEAISLSSDGNTLAVGADGEESSGVGVNSGDQADNSTFFAGAVYLFRLTNGVWQQKAYLKASNTDVGDYFGGVLSLSADGNTLAVGAPRESSNGSNQADNSEDSSGAVYIFRFTNGLWGQEAYLKSSNIDFGDYFGGDVSLSSDGNTLAVGAYGESSNGVGVNSGDQMDNSEDNSGAVYLFRFTNGLWGQEAYLKASNSGDRDSFGDSLSLSADGNTLAVGAKFESSHGVGVNSDAQSNNGAYTAGAAYIY